MAQAAMKLDSEQEDRTALVERVNNDPVTVLLDQQRFEGFFDAIRQEVEAHTPDVSTEKGRQEIKSLAYKVARTKTAIDDAGKKLNEDARAKIAKVDAARRNVRQRFDDLRDQVRAPLTAWEEAEDARQAHCNEVIVKIQAAAVVREGETAAAVKARADEVRAVEVTEEMFRARFEMVCDMRDTTATALDESTERLSVQEAEREELARLRAERAERERQEAERQAAERAQREREEREAAEATAREQRAKEEEERRERQVQEAAERARHEAEENARREREAREREHQAELDRIRREREAEAAAKAAEQAERDRRERDLEHRKAIMGEAKTAFMTFGMEEAVAKSIVLAIVAGQVPHTSIQF